MEYKSPDAAVPWRTVEPESNFGPASRHETLPTRESRGGESIVTMRDGWHEERGMGVAGNLNRYYTVPQGAVMPTRAAVGPDIHHSSSKESHR